jgi:hypothetical protein
MSKVKALEPISKELTLKLKVYFAAYLAGSPSKSIRTTNVATSAKTTI